MKNTLGLAAACFALPFLLSCGGSSDSGAPAPANPTQGLPFGIPQNAAGFPAPSNVEVVDHQKLKAELPEKFSGWKRTKHEGMKTEVMGYRMSMAEARFKNDAGGSIEISIADIAGLVGPSKFAVAAWLSAEIDKETEGGYERTTRYKGYKGYEKVEDKGGKANLSVIVGDRFVVGVRGSKVDLDTVKSAMDRIDLGRIKGLK